MKPRAHLVGLLALTFFALAGGGCGNAAQEKALAQALQHEQQATAENAPAVIAEYQRVIALEPGSGPAKQAAARIQALEARIQAAEQHKDVFQEHGVD